jgi:hypothetical protein
MAKADDKTPGTAIARLGDDVRSCGEGNSASISAHAARRGVLFYQGEIEKTWESNDAGRQVPGDVCAVEIAVGKSGRDTHLHAHNEVLPCLMAAAGLKFVGSDKVLSALNRFLRTHSNQAIEGVSNETLQKAIGHRYSPRPQRQLPGSRSP